MHQDMTAYGWIRSRVMGRRLHADNRAHGIVLTLESDIDGFAYRQRRIIPWARVDAFNGWRSVVADNIRTMRRRMREVQEMSRSERIADVLKQTRGNV